MWIMTPRGFYSVVQHRQHPDQLLVRARCARDAQALQDLLPEAQWQHTPQADYAWRVQLPAEQWAQALQQLAQEIRYPNFKDAVQDPRHHQAYLQVWADLLQLQDGPDSPQSTHTGGGD